jgi:hypothetical protein
MAFANHCDGAIPAVIHQADATATGAFSPRHVGINAEALQSLDALFANGVAPESGEKGHPLARQSRQLNRHHSSCSCWLFEAAKGSTDPAGLG